MKKTIIALIALLACGNAYAQDFSGRYVGSIPRVDLQLAGNAPAPLSRYAVNLRIQKKKRKTILSVSGVSGAAGTVKITSRQSFYLHEATDIRRSDGTPCRQDVHLGFSSISRYNANVFIELKIDCVDADFLLARYYGRVRRF